MASPQDPRPRVSALRDLPQSIEPGRDLWPLIEARLRQTPASAGIAPPPAPGRARLRWLAAAAMVAMLAVGMWIGRTLLPVTAAGGGALRAAAGGAVPGFEQGSALDASYVSDPRYERQRAALLSSLQARLATLSPETRDKVLASLATVEKAKEDLETALGKDPSNALLQELLVNTYQDEMRVLTDVREASDPGRGI